MENKKLFKSRTNKMIDGVCGGLGNFFNIDPTIVRVIYAVASLFLGFFIGGIILYIILDVIMPYEA